MVKLVVRLHGKVIQTLELSDPATTYWAGRSENCQVVLNHEKGISRQHFKINLKEGLWNLEVTSTYGDIKTGETTVRELVLQEGTSFSLTPYEFHVESIHTQSHSSDLALASGDARARSSSSAAGSPHQEFEKTVTRVFETSKQYTLAYFNKDTNESKVFILTKNEYVIGRDPGCDIVLNDARVSRRQFKLINKNGSFYLMDNLGINATKINKIKVTSNEPQLLSSNDEIKILSHKLKFEIRDSQFESQWQKVKHLALIDPADFSNNPDLNDPSLGEGSTANQSNETTDSDPAKILNFWGIKIALTKKNKIRMGLVGLLLIVAIVISSDNSSMDPNANVANQPANPLAKLTPEEQKQVKVQYELAKDLYTKGNYQMAKEELTKVHAKIPSYLDSLELARFIEVGIQSAQEREQQERLKREAAEIEEKIVNIVAFCRQQLKPDASIAESDDCLSPAIQLNPEHELLVTFRGEIARVEEQRKTLDAERAFKAAQAAELEKQYKLALEISQKDPYKGKQAFEDFLKLTMDDPKKLQDKAKRDIKRLERKIKQSISSAINSVKTLVEEGKHRQAIIALEKAVEMSPPNHELDEEIEKITEDLRKKMQALYQEAILEENIGNVDTAKDRWKKIIEQDIPNGEYHNKAKIKLKKYGG